MDILIFGDITTDTARYVATALQGDPNVPVTVKLNSVGGSVADAITIHNALKAHLGKVMIKADFAASAATLIACAGDCIAAENAMFMIHGPGASFSGKAAELRETADVLDQFSAAMTRIYCHKTHRPVREIAALLADGKDHWFTAQDARDMGLVDAIDGFADAALITAALSKFNPPARFKLMSHEAVTAINHVDAIEAKALVVERQRQTEIRATFSYWTKKFDNDPVLATLQETLLVNGASPKEASEQLLRALGAMSGPLASGQGATDATIGNPVSYGGYGGNYFTAAAADALALRMGAKIANPHAAARDLSQTSLTELMEKSLQAAGVNTHGMSRDRRFTAALTSSDYPNLLGGAANRALVSHFEALTQDHRELCNQGDAPDFKVQKAVNVSLFPALQLKPEGGEITLGTINESAESCQLLTYAREFSFSREAQINDDTGGFQGAIQAAGNAAARLERDLVFGVLTANKTLSDGVALFHATHKNLNDSHSLVNITGLGLARALMRKQQDSSGGFVMTAPRFLLVPVGLETEAEALVSSLTYRPDLAGEMQTPGWVKGLRVIADPRLDAVDAGDWYLLSEPAVAPVIRLTFLNGQRSPVVEQSGDFSRDIIRYKVRLDVAATAVGYAGAVKMS